MVQETEIEGEDCGNKICPRLMKTETRLTVVEEQLSTIRTDLSELLEIFRNARGANRVLIALAKWIIILGGAGTTLYFLLTGKIIRIG